MGRRPHGVPGQGEGAHPPTGRPRRRPAPAADGAGREGVRLRGAGRQGHPPRPVRGPPPAHRGPLHVRPSLGRRLPQLLCRGRWRCRRGCSSTSTCGTRRSPTSPGRPSPRSRTTSSAGVDVPLVLVVRERLQLRLPRHPRPGGRAGRCTTTARRRSTRPRAARATSRASGPSRARAGAPSCATATTSSTPTPSSPGARRRSEGRTTCSTRPPSAGRRSGRSPRAVRSTPGASQPDFSS